MTAGDWSAWPRDVDGRRLAELPIVSAEARPRYNDVGTYAVAVPFTPARWEACGPGRRLEVRRHRRHLIAGPIIERELTVDANHPGGLIEVVGESDETLLADRIVYPDPTRPGTDQTTLTRWRLTGAAETIIKQLVAQQTGQNAHPSRRLDDLIIEPDAATGRATSAGLRYDNMLDALQVLARRAGLGFRVEPTLDGRIFRVFTPRDLSATVRFSFGLGNLGGARFRESAPTTTYALVGGAGEGTARRQEARQVSPLWGRRIEVYVDQRQTDDVAELAEAADDALADGAPATTTSLQPVVDLDLDVIELLGARVAVQIGPAGYSGTALVTDVVREVRCEFDLDAGTDTAAPVVGTDGASSDQIDVRRARDLSRRIANLERN